MAQLVVVSGAPASGKTILARALADELDLSVLEKDALKEALSDAVGLPADVAASSRLGSAAYAACFSLARGLLADDVGVVLESNFRRGLSETELLAVAAVSSSVHLVHCTARENVIMERYRARSRHAVHLDDHRYDGVRADLAAGRYEPLLVDWPTIVVQTDSGYNPSLDDITAFVRAG